MSDEGTVASGRLIYAASEQCPDLLYLTGLPAPDPFLWYETGTGDKKKQVIVVSPLEVGRAAKKAGAAVTVLSTAAAAQAWGLTSPSQRRAPDLIPAMAKAECVVKWRVPDSFPLGLARKLENAGLVLEPMTTFCPRRARKTKAEIQAIREGVAAAENGMQHALDILRRAAPAHEGGLYWQDAALTAERLRGEIDAEIARCGGTAAHTIVAPGAQAADPHEAGHGPLRSSEPVVIDIFPRVDATGYHGDLTRTVVKGDPPAIADQAYRAVLAAQSQAIAAVRPGLACAELHAMTADTLSRHGFETDMNANPPRGFFHGTGHGLGLEIHEAPRLSRHTEEILEVGNVVTIEPGVYYPEWGGVRIEDVVVVTENGCENLTRAPKDLVV